MRSNQIRNVLIPNLNMSSKEELQMNIANSIFYQQGIWFYSEN